MKKVIFVFALILLTGCGQQNTADTKVSTSSNTATSTKNSTTPASQKKSSSSQNTSSTTSPTTNNSSASDSINPSSDSTNSSTNQAAATTTDPFPYAVSLEQVSPAITFHLNGSNIPQVIELIKNQSGSRSTIRFNLADPSANKTDPVATFYAQLDTIPTKEIRIASADDSGIRTVKVNTQVTILNTITNPDSRDFSSPCYLFINRNNGISLATPNYAGNYPIEQQDVMLEYI